MKVLLLNQCFWPDVVSTAQHLTDLAIGLSERGHEVTVIAGRRGYDDPGLQFSRRERLGKIKIVRVPAIAAGKDSRLRRAINFASFLIACAFRLAVTPRQDVIVALTSPPLISCLASWFVRLKRGRLVFWVMDLNPDEAIAAGWLKTDSVTTKLLAALLKNSMNRSDKIVALDRFMKQRIVAKGIAAEKVETIPPWSRDGLVRFDEEGREAFRREHNLSAKLVVMYAGNHSPCHPLDTLLLAARELRDRDDIVFCFVGGGSEHRKVSEFEQANNLGNVRCLPYQPPANLAATLSAADLHVVVMGEPFVGIVHPCKVYNILAIGSPFLYIGPTESHMGDIVTRLADRGMASSTQHGQVNVVVDLIRARVGNTGARRQPTSVSREFSRDVLLPQMVAQIEAVCDPVAAIATEPSAAKLQSV